MGQINVVGLASSWRVPGILLAVLLGGVGTSAGVADKKILLIGNRITTTLTGSTPAFSCAAGTGVAGVEYLLSSADDEAQLSGRGAELHGMAVYAFAQYPNALLYSCSTAESAGASASAVYTFVTSSSAAYSVRVYCAGRSFDVAIASGQTVTQIATAVATAINNVPDLPVTAQIAAGVLTVTAKHPGPRGNDIVLDLSFVLAAGRPIRIGTSSTSSTAGTTCTLSANGSQGSEFTLAGGTTADTIGAVLAAIESKQYDVIVCALYDATAVDALMAQVNAQAGVTSQTLQQVVIATPTSLGTATTLATGRNQARAQAVWHFASPVPPPWVTAQVAAGRLIGDGAAGGQLVGEATDPAANLDGLRLATVPTQRFPADQPTGSELQSALSNGLTPLTPADSGGLTQICRSITTRSLAGGAPNYAVLDTSNVTVTDAVAFDLHAYLFVALMGAKLGVEDAQGNPPRARGVTTPKAIRGLIYQRLKFREVSGWIRNVDARQNELVVLANADVTGRVDAEIPCEPVPGLHIVGGNVRQLS